MNRYIIEEEIGFYFFRSIETGIYCVENSAFPAAVDTYYYIDVRGNVFPLDVVDIPQLFYFDFVYDVIHSIDSYMVAATVVIAFTFCPILILISDSRGMNKSTLDPNLIIPSSSPCLMVSPTSLLLTILRAIIPAI